MRTLPHRRKVRRSDDDRWDVPSGRGPRPDQPLSFQATIGRMLRASGGLRSSARARAPDGLRSAHSRRVVVKARIVQVGKSHGQKAAKLHLAYLERDGVAQDGSPGSLYGANGAVERAAFNQDLEGEQRQFRIILSPEDGHALDLSEYVRAFMLQVEQDAGHELRWAAVNHYNTDQPHAHIIIRGVDAKGAEVRLAREYISHGMRHRAEDLATERLGARPELSRLDQLKKEAVLERFTSLDRELERRARVGKGLVRSSTGRSRDPALEAALRTRLETLAGLGLVERAGRNAWRLDGGLREKLQVMGRRAEGLRAIRSVVRAKRSRVIDRNEPNAAHSEFSRGELGIVRWKGLDEDGRFVAVVETTGGDAYHLPMTERAAIDAQVGRVVAIKRAADKDQHIEEVARAGGGIFDMKALEEPLREAYRHRLEQLRRSSLAARDPSAGEHERWLVRLDFRAELAKGKPQPLWQALSIRSEELSLEAQKRYAGPVWLDQVPPAALGPRGFGAEVQQALEARHEYLRSQGLEPGAEKLHGQLLKLQQERLQQALVARGGVPSRRIDGFKGVAQVHAQPNGRRFLEVRSGSSFVLIPASRAASSFDGKSVRLGEGERGRVRLEVVNRDRGLDR